MIDTKVVSSTSAVAGRRTVLRGVMDTQTKEQSPNRSPQRSQKPSSNLLSPESALDAKGRQQRSNSLTNIVKMHLSSAKSKLFHRLSLSAEEGDKRWMGETSAAKDADGDVDDDASRYKKWTEKRRSLFGTTPNADEYDGPEYNLYRKQAVDNSGVQENIAAVASSLRVHEALRESGLI